MSKGVEILPSELDTLTLWVLDSLARQFPQLKLDFEDSNRLFPTMRTWIEACPIFRVVAWRKGDQ